MFLATRPNPDEIRSALACIPAHDRKVWVRIAMAVKAALGDTGFPIWDKWSQSSESYRKQDAIAVWRSIGSGAVGVGSLFHVAREYGWRGERRELRPVQPRKAPEPPKSSIKAYALRLWLAADCSDSAVTLHPYSIKKSIDWAAGAGRGRVSGRVVGQDADCVIIPIRDLSNDRVVGVQAINTSGDKQSFGDLSGNGLILGNSLDRAIRWYVVEGWADAVSMAFHVHKGNAVAAAAFGKHNMMKLAQRMADVYQPEQIIVLEDAE